MSIYEFINDIQNMSGDIPFVDTQKPHMFPYDYMQFLRKEFSEKDPLFVEKYQAIVAEEDAALAAIGNQRPFLSAVVRTQGKRPEMLRETLLTLYGQTDDDFEVVLVMHKTPKEKQQEVADIIDEQPASLRERIRCFELNEGNRTAPLNFGFAHARGEYIIILDDDDIVMDHWVSSFHEAAKNANGAILHAYTCRQDWEVVPCEDGREGLAASGTPSDLFCVEYDFIRQMRINRCPPVGLAFPGYFFRNLGKIFSEDLTTTEDWDYLMRACYITGVVDISYPTSVYRNFTNTSNSATMHKQVEWNLNINRIVDKLYDMPVTLSPQDWKRTISINPADRTKVMMLNDEKVPKGGPIKINNALLFMSNGDTFSESHFCSAPVLTTGPLLEVEFNLRKETAPISHVRVDLTEEGIWGANSFSYFIHYHDGTVTEGHQEDFETIHGFTFDIGGAPAIWFEDRDPYFSFAVDSSRSIDYIRVYAWKLEHLPIDLQNRCEFGCIVPYYLDHYQAVYQAYCNRMLYFRKYANKAKAQMQRDNVDRTDEIKEKTDHYHEYRLFLKDAIAKDLAWCKVHSKKAFLQMKAIQAKFNAITKIKNYQYFEIK